MGDCGSAVATPNGSSRKEKKKINRLEESQSKRKEVQSLVELRGLVAATLTREVAGSNPGKSHWWTTGRASGPKMLTAPEKSQLTIWHRPSPVKTGSV